MNSQEIFDAMARWASSFSEDTTDNICSLYGEHASLWGTLSPIKRDSAYLIKDYFDNIFKYPNRNVQFSDSTIRFFGEVAICNGFYTFNWLNNNIEVTTSARFSIVYINKDGCWLIIDHHSSFIPVLA